MNPAVCSGPGGGLPFMLLRSSPVGLAQPSTSVTFYIAGETRAGKKNYHKNVTTVLWSRHAGVFDVFTLHSFVKPKKKDVLLNLHSLHGCYSLQKYFFICYNLENANYS